MGIADLPGRTDSCVACGDRLTAAARFCPSCGTARSTGCPFCSAEVAPGARFCSACGRPIRSGAAEVDEGEHRFISVVFCDIVDSTGLTERIGAEAMHSLLDRFVSMAAAKAERWGGTLVKVMGDGVMVAVGTEVAHEDHAERALLIADALRAGVAELSLPSRDASVAVRIGVNSGSVVLAEVGGHRAVERAAVGETVNLAARLQAAAAPSEILVGEGTVGLLRDASGLESVGRLALRGCSAPLGTYRLSVAPTRAPAAPWSDAASPFVGRQRPLALLRDLLEQAGNGEGQVVCVVAEAGMGKTRLLREFRRMQREAGVRWLEGRCRSYGDSIPYVPVIDVLRQMTGTSHEDPPDVVRDRVGDVLRPLTGEASERPALLLADLLGAGGEESPAGRMSSAALRARTLEALELALLPPGGAPTILVVEDVQWIDPSSREVLNHLADRLVESPLLLLMTQRPGARLECMSLAHATQLPLSRLGPDDATAVLRAAARAQLGDEALGALLARGEGNPMFLEQLAAHASLEASVAERIPESVQSVLGARVDRLRPRARRVLQTAAVLGRQSDRDLLRALLSDDPHLDEALGELVDEGFLFERRGGDLTFRHALIQEVAYAGLLSERRRALHRLAAGAIERASAHRGDETLGRLAHHFAQAADQERAVEYLRELASSAAGRHAHSEAARALEQALSLLADMPGRERDTVDLTIMLVRSRYFLGQLETCRRLLEEQEERVSQASDQISAAQHRFWLAHILSHSGDTDGADREARRAVTQAQALGDRATSGRARYVLARESVWRARYPDGVRHGGAAVDDLSSVGDAWWLAYAHCWLAANEAFLGRFDDALASTERARAIGEALGDDRVASYATGQAAWFKAMSGDGPGAVELGQEAVARTTDPLGLALATAALGLGHREAGEPGAAVAALDRAIAEMERFGYRRLVCWYTAWRADARLAAGDGIGAVADAEKARSVSRMLGSPWSEALALRTLGCVARGRGPRSERLLREALRIFERIKAEPDAARTRALLQSPVGDAPERQRSELAPRSRS